VCVCVNRQVSVYFWTFQQSACDCVMSQHVAARKFVDFYKCL